MKKCQRCGSDRIVEMVLYLTPDNGDESRYKNKHINVGLLFNSPEALFKNFCGQCGQMQGEFPISEKRLLGNCFEIEKEEQPIWNADYVAEREKELGIEKHGL